MHTKAGAVLYAKRIARVAAYYVEVAGLALTQHEEDHVVLESPALQLTIVAIPEEIAGSIEIATPPVRRTDTPIKLVFPVGSIADARSAASRLGGEVNAEEREWWFQGQRVCDGHDPEGNVVQFRENPDQRVQAP